MRLFCTGKYLEAIREEGREEVRKKLEPILKGLNEGNQDLMKILGAWAKTGGLEVAEIRPYRDKPKGRNPNLPSFGDVRGILKETDEETKAASS